MAVEIGCQAEGVAAADVDAFARLHGGHRILEGVDALQEVTGVQSLLVHELHVPVVVMEGPRHEQDPFDVAEVGPHPIPVDRLAFLGPETTAAQQESHCSSFH